MASLRERFQGEAVSLLVCNAGLLRADSLEEPHFGGAREQASSCTGTAAGAAASP